MFPTPFRLLRVAIFACYLLSVQFVFAQNSLPSQAEISRINTITLPDLDLEKLQREDMSKEFDVRFAAPIDCNFSIEKNGEWSESEEGLLSWTFALHSKNAKAMAFLLENFYLPEGAKLYLFSPDKKQKIGVYTSKNNGNGNVFLTDFLQSDTAVFFFTQPKESKEKASFKISKTYHVYKKYHLELPQNEAFKSESRDGDARADFGFDTSLPCHININCPEVDSAAQIVKKGVVRITMVLKEGIGYCTGTLMNNTAQDGKPYILTAFHCQDGYTPYYNFWKFDFKYESPNCSNPIQEPVPQSITGCNLRSGWQATDFLLLELTTPIANSFNAHYNGWNRSTIAPSTKVFSVHHASGDIKKYIENDGTNLTIVYPYAIKWNNQVTTPAQHHFKTIPTKGVIEVGSSGSGLFNDKKQLVGNFNGGDYNGCTVNGMYFGRLSKSWDGNGTATTRLKDWLDPLNTNAMELDGNAVQNDIIAGKIEDPLQKGTVFQLAIKVEKPATVFKIDTFSYSKTFAILIPKNAVSLNLQPFKNATAVSGVSTGDLVLMSKHILATQLLPNDWQLVAADVNKSGTISTADIVETRKIILDLKQDFDKQIPWNLRITNLNMPNMTLGTNGSIKLFSPYQSVNIIDFQGIKIGDVNGSGY